MDTPARTLAKSATWQVLGFTVMTAITYAATGSLATGGAVAAAGSAAGFASYVLHERAWAQVRWGRAAPKADAAARR